MSKYDFVRVMADHCSSGLWVKPNDADESDGHVMADHGAVGVSPELSDELNQWVATYPAVDNYGAPERDNDVVRDFDIVGRRLAGLLKKELGELVSVVYSPESSPLVDEHIS